MNEYLKLVSESETIRFADLVRRVEATGKKVIKLETGDPDFATHQVIIKAGYDAMQAGYTHYGVSRGLPELRAALARKLISENKITADPSKEILVTNGGVHGLYLAMQAILNPGDEVIVPEPYWMPYRSGTLLARAVPVIVSATQSGFKLTAEQLKKAITAKSKLLMLNSPGNPSGAVYSEAELRTICEIACDAGLYIISDEVYEKILHDDTKHWSIGSDDRFKNNVVSLFSFSKSYAMTGWRVAYVVANEALTAQMLKVLQYSITVVAPFVQKAALAALTHPESEAYLQAMKREYSARREVIKTLARQLPAGVVNIPDGAFYCLINTAQLGMKSLECAEHFLTEHNVSFTPGRAFGNGMENYLRMTFAASIDDIKYGMGKLISAFSK